MTTYACGRIGRRYPFGGAALAQLLKAPAATPTLLKRFMEQNAITVTRLAQLSGRSERNIVYLRQGKFSPTLECVAALASACSGLIGREVYADELFDIAARPIAEEAIRS